MMMTRSHTTAALAAALLGALLAAPGCAGGPSHHAPVKVFYAVSPMPPLPEQPPHYEVLVHFESEGTEISSPRLAVAEGQWATISIASMKDEDDTGSGVWQETDEGPRIDDTAGIDSGTFVAVRCTPGKEGLVYTELRTYYVDGDFKASRDMARGISPVETHRFEWDFEQGGR